MEMPWYKAQALRVWADAHLRRAVQEDIDQVRELLEEARSIFTGLGIEYYAKRVDEKLDAVELRLTKLIKPSPCPQRDWPSFPHRPKSKPPPANRSTLGDVIQVRW